MPAIFFCALSLWGSFADAAAPAGAAPRMSVCLQGSRTRLLMGSDRPVQMRHDEDVSGEAVFELVSKEGGKTLARYRTAEPLDCVGFDAHKGLYILDGTWESGVVSTVRGFWYWPESAPAPVESKFHGVGQEAFVRLWSPDFRYLVFIDLAGKLGVLDAEKDEIKILGDAPLPPPLGDTAPSSGDSSEFGWEFYAEQGTGTLEPGILSLVGGRVLKASYGQDTATARAKKRRVRTWNLDRIF